MSQQNDNGGFSWIDKATTPDSDSTGTALMALANHRGIDGVEEAIENSINYLKGIQKDDGGFGTSAGAEVNCNSTACVVMGLLACGENIVSDDWLKNGNSMINALLSFQLENGSFSHIAGTPSNELATKQALMALVRIVKSGVGGTNDSENPGDDESSEDKTVRVRVEGHTTNLADEVVTVNGTAMDALKAAVGEDQLEAPEALSLLLKEKAARTVL
ncbi:MAG: prenyltransferase/squalene oxidase repeat-containing protein [Bacillota bacterium]